MNFEYWYEELKRALWLAYLGLSIGVTLFLWWRLRQEQEQVKALHHKNQELKLKLKSQRNSELKRDQPIPDTTTAPYTPEIPETLRSKRSSVTKIRGELSRRSNHSLSYTNLHEQEHKEKEKDKDKRLEDRRSHSVVHFPRHAELERTKDKGRSTGDGKEAGSGTQDGPRGTETSWMIIDGFRETPQESFSFGREDHHSRH